MIEENNETVQRVDELQIRKELKKLIANEILFSDFQRWFFAETCCVDDKHSTSLQKLVYNIKLLFAEFSNRDWTKTELFSQLKELLAEDYYEDTIEDVLDEIRCILELADEFANLSVTTAKNKVILREHAETLKNIVNRLGIAIEMQHEVSDEDWKKPCHGLKFTRRSLPNNRVTTEDNEPPGDFDAEQECIDVLNKAIETLRQPKSPEKPSLDAVLATLQSDLEGIETRNPTSFQQRIRDLISGYIEQISDFSWHAHEDAVNQDYRGLLGWLDVINASRETIINLIEQYIPESERQVLLEEDVEEGHD